VVIDGKLLTGMPLPKTLSVTMKFEHKTFEILKMHFLTTFGSVVILTFFTQNLIIFVSSSILAALLV